MTGGYIVSDRRIHSEWSAYGKYENKTEEEDRQKQILFKEECRVHTKSVRNTHTDTYIRTYIHTYIHTYTEGERELNRGYTPYLSAI